MAESPDMNSLVGLVGFSFSPALTTMRSCSCREKKMRCVSWDAALIDETVQRLRGSLREPQYNLRRDAEWGGLYDTIIITHHT
jgi:hypothetical protein